MPDTGAPWNIPYVASTDLVSDWPADSLALANAIDAGLDEAAAADTVATITATNASWPVPSLGNPVVKVTVIGGGGGGSSCVFNTGGSDGGQGGTTSFDAGVAGTLTATGGLGGKAYYGAGAGGNPGHPGTDGASAGNGGQSQARTLSSSNQSMGNPGNGGTIVVGYLDLTGISTVNVTIGAGGAAGSGAAAGGRGEVIVEYKAA